MNITAEEIDHATLEAIYWWNRDEYYYHRYFSQFDKIYENKEVLDFFRIKIFEVFLREYAVRRNLSAGTDKVRNFIDELFKYNFFASVKNGETKVIDVVSQKLIDSGKATKRNTRSLLSKVAFLINPKKFSLYDNLAVKSISKLLKENKQFKSNELDKYSGFLNQSKYLHNLIVKENLFQNSLNILSEFPETEAFKFFSKNNEAFEMRIVDKFLWLREQNPPNHFNNQGYIELIKLGL